MSICPYPPPRCPIFTLDEHGGIVPTEHRNEDEDFRSAVQQLLASDDIDDDNTVTDKVESDEKIEPPQADGDEEKGDLEKENRTVDDNVPSQNATMSACLRTFQAAQAEMSQLINLIDLSRGDQFVSVERVTKTLPLSMSSVAIKELSQQRSRHLVRAANLLRRRTQHLRDVSEKQWVLLHNLQSVRKAWRIVATSRGKVPVALRLGDPMAVDVAYADESPREIPLESNYLWGREELSGGATSSSRRPLHTIEVTVRCLQTGDCFTIRAPRTDLNSEGDEWKSMMSSHGKLMHHLLNEQHSIRCAIAFRGLQREMLDDPPSLGHRANHPVASEVMQIENDLFVLSLDDRNHVSFCLTTQKHEDYNNLKEVLPKKEGDNDMIEIDDVMKTRPLEGMARYALTVLISCDGECFQSSPAQLITDSLRHYILRAQVLTSLTKISSEARSSLGIPLCSYWSVLDSMTGSSRVNVSMSGGFSIILALKGSTLLAESIPNVLKPHSKRHLYISGTTHLEEFLRHEIAIQVLGHLQSMAIALLLPCELKHQAASLRVLSKSPSSELGDDDTSCVDVYFQCGKLPLRITWSVSGGKLLQQQLVDKGLVITNSASGCTPVDIVPSLPLGRTIVDKWKVAIQCMKL